MEQEIKIGTLIYKTYVWHPYVVIGETDNSWILWLEGEPKPLGSLEVSKGCLPEGWMLDKQRWLDWCFARWAEAGAAGGGVSRKEGANG